MKIARWLIQTLEVATRSKWSRKAVASFLKGTLNLVKPRGGRIDSNLKLVYPEMDVRHRSDLRRRIYDNLAWTVTELLALQSDPSQALGWVKKVEGREIMLDEFVNKKTGVILLTGHFGNWELMGSWGAQMLKKVTGKSLYVVYQRTRDRDVGDLILSYRQRMGMQTISKDASVIEMARILRRGDHLALLADVSWIGGEKLPFMGHLCTNATGPAGLSILTGAPIVPTALYRDAPFSHTISFFPPISVPQSGSREERMRAGTLAVNEALETIIRRAPELWFWLHNRWKD